jgi:putative Mg2+ transporter-C (MgtC) family protein
VAIVHRTHTAFVVHDWSLLLRVIVALGLAYVVGFERELRGSPAGDRTFALIGVAAAALTAAVYRTSPQAIAGIVTGVGFVGAAVLFRTGDALIRGITTASAIFAVAAIGVVVGTGHYILAAVTTLAVLAVLELRYISWLSRIDARRYAARFRNDWDPPPPPNTAPPLD